MFQSCKNLSEAKNLFRKLALRLHPDCGGSPEMMVCLTQAHESFIQKMKGVNAKEKLKSSMRYENVFEEIMFHTATDWESERLSILGEIAKYAKFHKHFNCAYVSSVIEFAEENGFITSGQYNALVKIYYAFRINDWIDNVYEKESKFEEDQDDIFEDD